MFLFQQQQHLVSVKYIKPPPCLVDPSCVGCFGCWLIVRFCSYSDGFAGFLFCDDVLGVFSSFAIFSLICFSFFYLILNVPFNNFSFMLGHVFLG